MSWLISTKQYIPAVIGEAWGGGYFAGYISHTADGNPTHALIVAPRATGATGTGYTLTANLQWKTTDTTTSGTTSSFDGAANTAAMVAAGINDHPAAKFCKELTISNFSDWYLPARFELDIAYFNLKPNTNINSTQYGTNAYAVPARISNYTSNYPAITSVSSFANTTEGFSSLYHFSSTENNSSNPWCFDMFNGTQNSGSFLKTAVQRVRAFRRIAL